MTHPTRRGFLSLLAHLPIVGVLFSERVCGERGVGLARSTRPARFSSETHVHRFDETGRETVAVFTGDVAVIRWVPVTDVAQLPACDQDQELFRNALFGFTGRSRTVLVTTVDGEVIPTTRWQYKNGHCDWGTAKDVTHWAEIPKGPIT